MDSRIREIEQWVAEAKADLGECGREAYINKLFLLDAEIKAIIRANGILPAAVSPRQQQPDKVRRFTAQALVFAGVAAVLLLTASTVYLTLNGNTQPSATTLPPLHIAAGDNDSQAIIMAGYIPGRIPGEEILPDGWTPPVASRPQVPQPLSSEQAPVGAIIAAVPAPTPAPATSTTGEQPVVRKQPVELANNATVVIAIAPNTGAPQPSPATVSSNNAPSTSSYVSGGVEREVGFNWFPESERQAEPINQTKAELGELLAEQLAEIEFDANESVNNVDNLEEAAADVVDGEEPELDESALRELLENTLNKRSKR